MKKLDTIDFDKVIRLVKAIGVSAKKPELRDSISEKSEHDYVTAVDMRINAYLKRKLSELDNSIGFFSEEETGELSDPCWILDPIDGTTNLIRNYKMSGISLALYEGGKIVFGVVYNPFTEECFSAIKGNGAYLNGEKISVSDRIFKDAIVEFGCGSTHKEDFDENWTIGGYIFYECMDIRRTCCASLALCYIACGRIEGYFEKILKPWDIAAGSLILEEAGGKCTSYDNRPVDFYGETDFIASNCESVHKGIHSAIVEYWQLLCAEEI